MIEPITSDDDLRDLREGAIVTLKGKLENVRYGGDGRSARGEKQNIHWPGASLVVTFADWSMVAVNVVDGPTAKGIRIPLSSYVTVKARVIDEDGTLEAIAIWTPGGVPQPLARDPEKASGDLTERKSA